MQLKYFSKGAGEPLFSEQRALISCPLDSELNALVMTAIVRLITYHFARSQGVQVGEGHEG